MDRATAAEKIRKLDALAARPGTPAEGAAARRIAAELRREHGIGKVEPPGPRVVKPWSPSAWDIARQEAIARRMAEEYQRRRRENLEREAARRVKSEARAARAAYYAERQQPLPFSQPAPCWDASVVTPRVWVGSYGSALFCDATRGVGLIVLLAGGDFEAPDGVDVFYRPFADEASHAAIFAAKDAAHKVERWLLAHQGVALVTCAAGINRSAFVAALVVRNCAKITGKDAMAIVRRARPGTLTNTAFARYLEGLGRA